MLLFNNNLSPRLPARLADLYPGSLHVITLDMLETPDLSIWRYALEQGLTIATKDNDYRGLSETRGFPPKVILLTSGNSNWQVVATLLRERYAEITAFISDTNRGLLELP